MWSVYHELVDPITVLSSNIQRQTNLGTVVAPQGDHGASECEAGGGLWDLNGVNAVRAPLEPRASLVVRATLYHGVSQDGRAGLSENAVLGIFSPSKMRVLPHRPPHR